MSGWERMKNNICTVYSCTDYCGITGNSAGNLIEKFIKNFSHAKNT